MTKSRHTYSLAIIRKDISHYKNLAVTPIKLDESSDHFNDTVMMNVNDYKTIFGKRKSEMPNSKKRLSVVRIISGEGYVIYRRFYGSKKVGAGKVVGLSKSSIMQLTNDQVDDYLKQSPTVELSKGNRFMYYWTHPFHATRISAKLGFISILLAALSIAITFLSK